MQKTCRICGKVFVPYRQNHVLCSDECRKIKMSQYQKQYQKQMIEEKTKEKYREYCRSKPSYKAKLKPHICTICGKPIERYANMHQIRHDECVLQAIVDSLNKGNPLTNKQCQQLYCRGYSIAEFYMEYADVLDFAEPIPEGEKEE